MAIVPLIAFAAVTVLSFFFSRTLFYISLVFLIVGAIFVIWRYGRIRYDIRRFISRISDNLNQGERDSLAAFPLPVAVCSSKSEVIWYNEDFRTQVLDYQETYGEAVDTILPGVNAADMQKLHCVDIVLNHRCYSVYISPLRVRDTRLYVLYYVDNTQLKEIAQEYALSRPSVMLVYIDNIDEAVANTRESERAQLSGRVETMLEDLAGSTTGIIRKYTSDRFMLVIEQRHLDNLIENKFDILDRVRTIRANEQGVRLTLSIGVGSGETMAESEQMAQQAMEMALGRGGDQAAVKSRNGFEFYGGVSKGVEKRTKVRTRVIASALLELINSCENVLVMGHRFSDLDCVGSACALAAAARQLNKPAYVVTQRGKTLAPELIERYIACGSGDIFIEPDDAMSLAGPSTLLLITDTHSPRMLEWLPLYETANNVVVIDHHRKMVDHIDNAVIFYHEPYASSASEMVAELIQYMVPDGVAKLEAEALLAGIMLDTKSFVMKSGVRTFEAAAYLRRQGADTVEVKRLFAGSMETYRKKADIIAKAYIYRCTAITCDESGDSNVRVATSQAADELLSIKGVDASFAMFTDGDDVNVSARSLGDFNVQLVMEAIGGGGHLTMAGALLKNTSPDKAQAMLKDAINAYLTDRQRAIAVQAAQSNGD